MAKSLGQQKRQPGKGKGPSKHKNAERRQGRRFLFVWLPIIVVVLIFFYASVFDPARPAGQPVPGTSREGKQTRTGDATGKTYHVVLDDGRIVTLDGSQMGALDAGRRLLVQENVTLIFKRKSFSFVKYVE
jgi:hypothetical protein